MQKTKYKYIALDGLLTNGRFTSNDIRLFQTFLLNPGEGLESVYSQFLMRIVFPEEDGGSYINLNETSLDHLLIDAFCWTPSDGKETSVDNLLRKANWMDIHLMWENFLDKSRR